MTEPTSPSTCPDCAATLPTGSPQELCPSCLMRQALASHTIASDRADASTIPPPTPEEIAGQFPQFEILECLGRGGMGVVYKARQKSLNRLVAIKILASERAGEEQFAERFAHEAKLLAQLNHPHIVTIHDFGETDGLYYLVMEFVDGVNLRDLITEGKLETTQALAIVSPICEALQYAHEKGIVHRDIKPENLLLDKEGRLKIADFGIASLIGSQVEASGTPPYMAPEQATKIDTDHRADIYALGVVLYEMLTGERPTDPLSIPSQKVQLDIRIDDIVLRALSADPERRYQTAGDFRTMVETVSKSHEPPSIPPSQQPLSSGVPQKPVKKPLFIGCLIAFLVAAFLFLVAVVLVFLVFQNKPVAVDEAWREVENGPLVGWATVKLAHSSAPSSGFTLTIPLEASRKENWFPKTGQQLNGPDGNSFLVKTRVQNMSPKSTEISVSWSSAKDEIGGLKSVMIGPGNLMSTLEFSNGLEATIHWSPPVLEGELERNLGTESLKGFYVPTVSVLAVWIVIVVVMAKKNPRVFRRWWLIPIMIIAGALCGLLYGFLKPRKFEATSVVLEMSQTPMVEANRMQDINFLRNLFGFKMAQFHSRSVLESTSERLSLAKRWGLSESDALLKLEDAVSTSQRMGTDLIEVSVCLPRAEDAIEIANTLPLVLEDELAFNFQVMEPAKRVRSKLPRPFIFFIFNPVVGALIFSFLSLALLGCLHRRSCALEQGATKSVTA